MRTSAAVIGFVVIGLAPAWVAAQGLGDVAKREKARRSETKPAEPAKVYTNDSIETSDSSHGTYSAPGGTAAPAPDAAAGTATRSPSGASAPPPAGNGEAYWRGRAASARAAVGQAERAVKDAETREAGYGPIIPGQTAAPCAAGTATVRPGEGVVEMRDRASGTVTCDPETLRILAGQKAHAETGAARERLAAARKALDDLEDEARRAGALPGWLR